MINISDKSNCNGCCVCVDACPTKAISLTTDIEGFWYPEINKDTCIDCGLCEKVCPEIHASELKKNDFEKPICYAAIHKNLEILFDSTSGGIFSALAAKIYKEGGYVGGAIYNEDFSVRHFISNDKNDLEKLRSSKYLQSNASGFYTKIKELLTEGQKVLVCGTPCQMAGLRSFLQKDYENLIIADFICRGVNSPKVYRSYLDSLEKRFKSKIVYVKAKSKELGWHNLTTKVTFENGKSFFDTKETSLFTRGYLSTNVYCRPSCYTCKFKEFPRIADITLADFWGIEKVDKSLDNDLGTSLVLLNSKKGQTFFAPIQTKIICKKVEFETILPGNPALLSSLDPPKVDRGQFFIDLDRFPFEDMASKYISSPSKTAKQKIKQKIKQVLKLLLIVKGTTLLHPMPFFQFIKYNFFSKNISANWKACSFLIPAPHSVIEIQKKAHLKCDGLFRFGWKKFRRSKLESRLLVESGGTLEINGNFTFYYGADIEVFKGGELIINGGNGGANIGATIICGEKIVLGSGVQIGRNVTIRDNNGGHYISRQGYKNSRPIIIGDRVWLGEGCTIMPGVKIGDGAIVSAKSFVISNVPAHSIVSGNPARVVDVDVLWKY